MTKDEFMQEVSNIKEGWSILVVEYQQRSRQLIRYKLDGPEFDWFKLCPITVVLYNKTRNKDNLDNSIHTQAHALNLSFHLANRIIRASDDFHHYPDSFREELLKACNLP